MFLPVCLYEQVFNYLKLLRQVSVPLLTDSLDMTPNYREKSIEPYARAGNLRGDE